MKFEYPFVLYFLLLVPFFFVLFLFSQRFFYRYFCKFAEAKFCPYYLKERFGFVWKVKNLLYLTSFFFLIVAMSAPKWDKHTQKVEQKGVDVAICVDVSKSMDASDISPSRLARAKDLINLFVDQLPGDRVALIPFAGVAKIQCPLTNDYSTFRLFVDLLGTNLIKKYGTNIADALQKAIQVLTGEQKIILLISDGENLSGDVLQIAADLKKEGVRVYCVGVGTPLGSAVIDQSAGGKYVKDEQGDIVQSKLDMATLSSIAQTTGGRAYAITPNQSEIFTILEDISKMEKSKFSNKLHTTYKHKYSYFALLALLFLLLEFFVFRKSVVNNDRFLE